MILKTCETGEENVRVRTCALPLHRRRPLHGMSIEMAGGGTPAEGTTGRDHERLGCGLGYGGRAKIMGP